MPCLLPILVDGGIRSGQDVLKARALGAKASLIGRPWIYSVAARGEAGLKSMLQTYKSELEVSMALTGVNRISEVSSEIIRKK